MHLFIGYAYFILHGSVMCIFIFLAYKLIKPCYLTLSFTDGLYNGDKIYIYIYIYDWFITQLFSETQTTLFNFWFGSMSVAGDNVYAKFNWYNDQPLISDILIIVWERKKVVMQILTVDKNHLFFSKVVF